MTDYAFSDAIVEDWSPAYPSAAPAHPGLVPLKRPLWTVLPFILPVFFCGVSWLSGGISFITDTGFTIMVILCFTYVAFEVRSFARRFGIGSMILLGGTLVWYCHDYFSNWFGVNFAAGGARVSAATIAKGGYFTCLFVLSGLVGLMLPAWKRVINLTLRIPEPPTNKAYFFAVLASFAIGLIPFLFFSAEPVYLNIYHAMTGMRSGSGAVFTAGRTGNLNYSWGGYLAQVEQVGWVGGILGAFYAIVVPGRAVIAKTISMLIWLFWTLIAFGDGARGGLVFMALPVALLLFVKYNAHAAKLLKRFSVKAVLTTAVFSFVMLIGIQIQGSFRGEGFKAAELEEVNVFQNQGNSMFSEGLLGYQSFPELFNFTDDTYPASTIIQPIPDVIYRWAIGWIPRVLWHGKPGINEAAQWYNKTLSGGTAVNTTGGTIAASTSAAAYMSYGFAGVIEMGLLFGWLCKLAEHMLWATLDRPLAMLFSLGFATYLIRSFRDLTPHDFYPLAIGVVVVSIGISLLRTFMGTPMTSAYLPEVAAQ